MLNIFWCKIWVINISKRAKFLILWVLLNEKRVSTFVHFYHCPLFDHDNHDDHVDHDDHDDYDDHYDHYDHDDHDDQDDNEDHDDHDDLETFRP